MKTPWRLSIESAPLTGEQILRSLRSHQDDTHHNVILSEAKDLLFLSLHKKQALRSLRSYQDDHGKKQVLRSLRSHQDDRQAVP